MNVRVKVLAELDRAAFGELTSRYGVGLVWLAPGAEIPASYWGAPEAGLAFGRLFVRADTPLHSALHELAHYVCMSAVRRMRLFRDAGGDAAEECAVCYLQVLLADTLEGCSGDALLADMDRWGYSFREGSAARWFAGDGTEARAWLHARGLITEADAPSGKLRALR